MRITLANIVLAGAALQGPAQLRVNGQTVIQRADLFRALSAVFYERGNQSTTVSFSVSRTHESLRAAERHLLMHKADLPRAGELRFTIGAPGDTADVVLAGACLQSVDIAYLGTTTTTTYTLVGGTPTDGGPAPDIEPYDNVIRRGTLNIANAAQEVAVIFTTPLPTAPAGVNATVIKAISGDDDVFVLGFIGAPTTTGFTARLSAPVPNANYRLTYTAVT